MKILVASGGAGSLNGFRLPLIKHWRALGHEVRTRRLRMISDDRFQLQVDTGSFVAEKPSYATVSKEGISKSRNSSPRFSVVIPLYNKAKSIRSTIESVLAQTFDNFELVVVNDGSTDGSGDAVCTMKDPRIRLIDKPNGGVSSARNRGIAESKGEWIALLDGDDLWLPNHLENFVKATSMFPEANVFYTAFTTDRAKNFAPIQSVFACEEKDCFAAALAGHGIWTSCVCFRTALIRSMSMFREDLTNGEDWELWHRFIKREKIIFISEVTAVYRTTAEARASRRIGNLESRYLWHLSLKNLHASEYEYFERNYMCLLEALFPFHPTLFFKIAKRQDFLLVYEFPFFFFKSKFARLFNFFRRVFIK